MRHEINSPEGAVFVACIGTLVLALAGVPWWAAFIAAAIAATAGYFATEWLFDRMERRGRRRAQERADALHREAEEREREASSS